MRRGGRRGALTRHGFDLGPAGRGGPRRTEGTDELRASHVRYASTTEAWLRASRLPAKRFYNSCGGPRGTEGGADVDEPRVWAVAVDEGDADREGAAGIGGAAELLVDLEKQAAVVMRRQTR